MDRRICDHDGCIISGHGPLGSVERPQPPIWHARKQRTRTTTASTHAQQHSRTAARSHAPPQWPGPTAQSPKALPSAMPTRAPRGRRSRRRPRGSRHGSLSPSCRCARRRSRQDRPSTCCPTPLFKKKQVMDHYISLVFTRRTPSGQLCLRGSQTQLPRGGPATEDQGNVTVFLNY